MDLPTPPVLVTVTHGGRKIDAAVQLTKTGFVYVFDRATGKPLFPIEERAVPASTIPGERAAKSQPVPTRPPALVRQTFTEADLSTRTPEVAAELRERFRGYKPGSTFTPPSLEGTVTIPGLLGGANWSGASFDPASGLLFVNVNNLPYVLTIKPARSRCRYPYGITGYNHFRDRDGYPAVAPPWGQLVAVDLNAGEIRWQKTLGEYPAARQAGALPTPAPRTSAAPSSPPAGWCSSARRRTRSSARSTRRPARCCGSINWTRAATPRPRPTASTAVSSS